MPDTPVRPASRDTGRQRFTAAVLRRVAGERRAPPECERALHLRAAKRGCGTLDVSFCLASLLGCAALDELEGAAGRLELRRCDSVTLARRLDFGFRRHARGEKGLLPSGRVSRAPQASSPESWPA